MAEKFCLNCQRSSNEIPLLNMEYKNETYQICPQCLPTLIHKPQNLAGKLPGAEKFTPAEHEH